MPRITCRVASGHKPPCNWVKDGYCGSDGKLCKILTFTED